jgi:hypothetical protein
MSLSSDSGEDVGLREVREILFGESQREMTRQLAELNQRFAREVQSIQLALQEQRAYLESIIRAEGMSLVEKLAMLENKLVQSQHDVRSETQSEFAAIRNEVSEQLRFLAERFENKLVQSQHELRNDTQTEFAALRNQMDVQVRILTERLESDIGEVKREERRALSGLFEHLSKQLAVTSEPPADPSGKPRPPDEPKDT